MPDPPILYHYTDAFGVHGILSSNELWATATQFSNDSSEIDYAVRVAIETVAEIWKKKRRLGSWEQVLAEHLVRLLQTPLHKFGQPFIVSFCEVGDLLSQWRAYGRECGFALTFKSLSRNGSLALNSMNGFRTMIKKVVYDPHQQRERLRYLIRRMITLVNGFDFPIDSPKGSSAHVELSLILILEMTDWACTVKHQSFSEEREWRIITYPKGATLRGVTADRFDGVLVRPTSKLLLPYMILKPTPRRRLPLIEVRCGPSQYQEQSARAMNILLRTQKYKDVTVKLSDAPLRF